MFCEYPAACPKNLGVEMFTYVQGRTDEVKPGILLLEKSCHLLELWQQEEIKVCLQL